MLNAVEITIQNEERDAHVLGIGIKYVPDSTLSLEDVLKDLYNQGALIGAPHPTAKMAFGLGEKAITKYRDYFDFVELNGSLPFPANIVYNTTVKTLGKKLNLPIVAESDAHLTPIYFNKALIMVENSEDFNETDIIGFLKEQIKNGNYKNALATTDHLKLYQWILLGTRQ
jgi:predicted metal-dependent phosphoesterase TrpH